MEELNKLVSQYANTKDAHDASENEKLIKFVFISNDINRCLEVRDLDVLVLFSYIERSNVPVDNEEKFYEAINSVNDEMVTFSMEYDPDQATILLKSSVLYVEGVDVEKALNYFENIHNKYLNVILQFFTNLPDDISKIGAQVKEAATKAAKN